RDDGLDAAPAQVGAVAGGGVGLVAHGAAGPAAGPPLPAARDPDRVHHRDEPRGVAVLARAGQPGDRPAAPVSGQVNLGGQPAAGAAQRLPAGPGSAGILVIRRCPLWGHRRPGRGGPPPRADWAGPPARPPSPATRPPPPPPRPPPAAGPGSSPTSRPAPSGDAARRRSSSSRTHPAGPATGTPSGHPKIYETRPKSTALARYTLRAEAHRHGRPSIILAALNQALLDWLTDDPR